MALSLQWQGIAEKWTLKQVLGDGTWELDGYLRVSSAASTPNQKRFSIRQLRQNQQFFFTTRFRPSGNLVQGATTTDAILAGEVDIAGVDARRGNVGHVSHGDTLNGNVPKSQDLRSMWALV